MPNLPHLTPAEIDAELKGTEYDDSLPTIVRQNGTYKHTYIHDAKLNAARAIRLARENEELRALIDKLADALGGSYDFMCGMYMGKDEKEANKELAKAALGAAKALAS